VSTLVLIDGPNLFNDVDRYLSKAAKPENNVLRTYFTNWFDIDRLVQATIGDFIPGFRLGGLGVVIFHSEKTIGRSSVRIVPPESDQFWGRQGGLPGMSTVLVTVPGVQQEKTTKCPHCKEELSTELRSEKGVDTSMVTYLYEAADQWEEVFLFTNDADFVPPVQALRRRGKRVFVAAFETTSASALRRACQSFFPIPANFLDDDYALFRLLEPNGTFDQALGIVQARYPGTHVFSTDGGACPMYLLQNEDGNIENALVNCLGAHASRVQWLSSTKGREGRIFYRNNAQLGEAVRRHRDSFAGAHWQTIWRDDQ
jgi:hypothetical protein